MSRKQAKVRNRKGPKGKNVGKGGLSEWFAGHGGGKPDDRSQWGDWIAVTPVQKTIKREDGSKKTYKPGDIVGPCAVSGEPEWKDVTNDGDDPLKCMPREKAHDMSRSERAELAKAKMKAEKEKGDSKKPVKTPTFEKKSMDQSQIASRVALRYLAEREITRRFLAHSKGRARQVVANTLGANRNLLLEEDVRLAMHFRDCMVKEVARRIPEVDPECPRPPATFFDGDMAVDIQVFSHSGVHPQMKFHLVIPPDTFYQFAFGGEKPSLEEVYSGDTIPLPDLSSTEQFKDGASAVLKALRAYVKAGGSAGRNLKHSIVPSP